jgi:hypothetical protein
MPASIMLAIPSKQYPELRNPTNSVKEQGDYSLEKSINLLCTTEKGTSAFHFAKRERKGYDYGTYDDFMIIKLIRHE